jgi:hypothetical protein
LGWTLVVLLVPHTAFLVTPAWRPRVSWTGWAGAVKCAAELRARVRAAGRSPE